MKKLLVLLSLSLTLGFSNMVKAQECYTEDDCWQYYMGNFDELENGNIARDANIFDKEENLLSSLTVAIKNGQLNAVRDLVERGADVNGDNWENVPIFEAINGGHFEIVKYLAEKGALLNKELFGVTPLLSAITGERWNIVKLLVEKGADVNFSTALLGTPLSHAVMNQNLDIVRFLLNNGANAKTDGAFGLPPLFSASGNGNLDMVMILVEHGADLNKLYLAKTPLFIASEKGHLFIVKYLVERGANVNQKCTDGQTAASIAKENGFKEIAKFLRKHGGRR